MDQKSGAKQDASKNKASTSTRPRSGGISAWESETSVPGADLLAYLGKDPSLMAPPGSSGGSTSGGATRRSSSQRHSRLTIGDGNLAQALLTARQAVEASRRSTDASGGGAPGDRPLSSRRSLGNDCSSGSQLAKPVLSQQQPPLPGEASGVGAGVTQSLRGPGTAAPGSSPRQTNDSQAAAAGSPWASWAPGAEQALGGRCDGGSGGKGGAGAKAQDARLKGLIDSDDEGDGDDFQDLMTADDDVLFGTAGAGAGGTGGDGAKRRSTGHGVSSGGDDSSPGTVSSRGGLPPIGPSGQRLSNGRASTDCGSSGGGHGSNGLQGDCRRRSSTADGDGAQPLSARTAVSDGAFGQPVASSPRGIGSSLPEASGAHPLTPPCPPVHSHPLVASAAPLRKDSGNATNPSKVQPIFAPYAPPTALPQQWPVQGHVQSPPMHTAHVGEGLRPHQPARRYTPGGQANRSPVRGSGYVVSPAAVRPASPSGSPLRPGTQAMTTVHPQRSPRESHISGVFALDGSMAPDAEGNADGGASSLSMPGVATSAPSQRFGVLSAGHIAGGGFVGGAWAGQASYGAYNRFPAASVQHYGGGHVFRSTPINQLTSSAAEEGIDMAALGSGVGSLGAPRTPTMSPGRQNGRHGRHTLATPPPSAGSSGFFGHARDRSRSSLLAGHLSTSPHRGRTPNSSTSVGGEASYTPGRPSHSSKSPRRSGAVVGTPSGPSGFGSMGLSLVPFDAGDGADPFEAAFEAPRGPIVPTLPQHRHSTGIRHCGFMHAPGGIACSTAVPPPHVAMPVGANGPYNSSFSASRQKATDERVRAALLAKVLAGGSTTAAANAGAPAEAGPLPGLAQCYRGGAIDASSGGGAAAMASDGGGGGGQMAGRQGSSVQHSGPVQRHGSLPHLHASHPAAEQLAAVHQPSDVGQGQTHERTASERQVPGAEGTLPAMLAPGVRSYSLA